MRRRRRGGTSAEGNAKRHAPPPPAPASDIRASGRNVLRAARFGSRSLALCPTRPAPSARAAFPLRDRCAAIKKRQPPVGEAKATDGARAVHGARPQSRPRRPEPAFHGRHGHGWRIGPLSCRKSRARRAGGCEPLPDKAAPACQAGAASLPPVRPHETPGVTPRR